jgi:hypothetical protein
MTDMGFVNPSARSKMCQLFIQKSAKGFTESVTGTFLLCLFLSCFFNLIDKLHLFP